jgi:hypothetical protein
MKCFSSCRERERERERERDFTLRTVYIYIYMQSCIPVSIYRTELLGTRKTEIKAIGIWEKEDKIIRECNIYLGSWEVYRTQYV